MQTFKHFHSPPIYCPCIECLGVVYNIDQKTAPLMQESFYEDIVVVCSDLSGMEPHRHIGVGSTLSSGGEMIITLAWNARYLD